MNRDQKMLPQFLKISVSSSDHHREYPAAPNIFRYDVSQLRLGVHTRQYSDNRRTHKDASFRYTP